MVLKFDPELIPPKQVLVAPRRFERGLIFTLLGA